MDETATSKYSNTVLNNQLFDLYGLVTLEKKAN